MPDQFFEDLHRSLPPGGRSFRVWLLEQRHRKDDVGKISRDNFEPPHPWTGQTFESLIQNIQIHDSNRADELHQRAIFQAYGEYLDSEFSWCTGHRAPDPDDE